MEKEDFSNYGVNKDAVLHYRAKVQQYEAIEKSKHSRKRYVKFCTLGMAAIGTAIWKGAGLDEGMSPDAASIYLPFYMVGSAFGIGGILGGLITYIPAASDFFNTKDLQHEKLGRERDLNKYYDNLNPREQTYVVAPSVVIEDIQKIYGAKSSVLANIKKPIDAIRNKFGEQGSAHTTLKM